MESVFDADRLVVLDAERLTAVPHGTTRAYLRDIGLPDQLGSWFRLARGWDEGDVTIGGENFRRLSEWYPGRPYDMAHWLNIGGIGDDDIAVDVASGTVYALPENGPTPCVLNTDLQRFASFLHLLEVERLEYDGEAATAAGLDEYDPEGAAERLLAFMRGSDPLAPLDDPESVWCKVLRRVESGMAYQ
ncbi:hypothetical protein GCM10010441_05360 [Kitasatospora paracochleata]